ncbi:MAG: S-layer protein domain-containing protein [Methanothrix sp.]|nr:S-layer protein domain-containing protein [Methanothrix sp.]
MIVILFAAIPVYALEIRGSVAGSVSDQSNLFEGSSFTWDPQNFAGFYYDLDRDLGSETLTMTITGENRLSGDEPYGIIYETSDRTKALSNAKVDMTYGKLRVASIDNITGRIMLDNKDNTIALSKNKNTEIMPGIYIRTADNSTLRYYIYKEITDPGMHELRGVVAGIINGQSNLAGNNDTFNWNPQNFAGFYYDIGHDLGTETLTATLTDGNNLSGDYPFGLTYATVAQTKDFEYKPWGSYMVIGFLGEKCFAGYLDNMNSQFESGYESVLFRVSADENSLADEQLEQILLDEDTGRIVNKGESVKLKEGYELVLKGISDEGKVYLNLLKDGKVVDESFIAPSKYEATQYDKTYYYRKNVGSQENLAIIAVHFRTTYKDEDYTMAIADGIWQISETPTPVYADTEYDKMRIASVTADSIAMDNKDNAIILTKKSDIELMPGVRIRTANNDTLRFYIYRTEVVK